MKLTDEMRLAVWREAGRKGGMKGGRVTADRMTPDERRERARRAGLASAEVRRLKKDREMFDA